jgi:hypothetical protein
MRFGNGRDGLNIGPKEVAYVTRSYPGRGCEALFLRNGPRPAYSQECLPKSQAILKGFDYNTVTSF